MPLGSVAVIHGSGAVGLGALLFAGAVKTIVVGGPQQCQALAHEFWARRAAMDALAQRRVPVCAGHGEELTLAVSPDLIATERAVLGSEYFLYDELTANLERLRAHRACLAQIITHRYT